MVSLPAVQTITVPRQRAVAALLSRIDPTEPDGPERRHFRQTDPEPTTAGELTPENCGSYVVIRSKDFLGTVYGLLIAVEESPGWAHMTVIHLHGKKPITFRNDTEVLVLD